MTHVLGLCGSLRAGSYNRMLLEVAAGLLPTRLPMRVFDRLGDIPPYNADLDTGPPPQSVGELRRAIRAATGIIIATPEYNHGTRGCCATR